MCCFLAWKHGSIRRATNPNWSEFLLTHISLTTYSLCHVLDKRNNAATSRVIGQAQQLMSGKHKNVPSRVQALNLSISLLVACLIVQWLRVTMSHFTNIDWCTNANQQSQTIEISGLKAQSQTKWQLLLSPVAILLCSAPEASIRTGDGNFTQVKGTGMLPHQKICESCRSIDAGSR